MPVDLPLALVPRLIDSGADTNANSVVLLDHTCVLLNRASSLTCVEPSNILLLFFVLNIELVDLSLRQLLTSFYAGDMDTMKLSYCRFTTRALCLFFFLV